MEEELFIALLREQRDEFDAFQKMAAEGTRYYRNENDIVKSGPEAFDKVNSYLQKLGKAPVYSSDNRISTNWHRIFIDQKVGYLFTNPPQYDVPGDESQEMQQTLALIRKTLGRQFAKVIRQLATDASNCGRAWLTYWYKEEGQDSFSYYPVDPLTVWPVYDNLSIEPKLSYLLRECAGKRDGQPVIQYELWTDQDVSYYEKVADGEIILLKTETHTYGNIPFIEFKNNAEATNDLSMYKQLIDAIDKLLSGFANDIDDLPEVLWLLKNITGESSQTTYSEKNGEVTEKEVSILQQIKAQKFAFVDDEGDIDILCFEVPHKARAKLLELLEHQLYLSAMAVNPLSKLTDRTSGLPLEALYSLLELKASRMETEFQLALDNLLQAVLHFLHVENLAEIQQIWIRNKPQNDLELVRMINETADTVLSSETKTKKHPLVEQWQTERKQIEKEQSAVQPTRG